MELRCMGCMQSKTNGPFEENKTGLSVSGYEGTVPEQLVLPSAYNGVPVTAVDWYAFENCLELKRVEIGKNITTVNGTAFRCCENLTEVIIGNDVTTIGNSAFAGCINLNSVSMGNRVTSIGGSYHSGKRYVYQRRCLLGLLRSEDCADSEKLQS